MHKYLFSELLILHEFRNRNLFKAIQKILKTLPHFLGSFFKVNILIF